MEDDSRERRRIDRREFLRQSSLAGIGLSLLPLGCGGDDRAASKLAAAKRVAVTPGVRRYVPLGRTGLEISDIGFGSSQLVAGGEEVVSHAFERGINYFDTAGSYQAGEAERIIGKALEGKRDRVIFTSKVEAQSTDTSQALMQELEGSLTRLRTDYIDIFMNHAVNDVARLKNSEWGEFIERAKQQGKIRFSGMSGHGGNLVECIDYALDHDLLDVLLSAYNFAQDPSFYAWLKDALRSQFTRNLDVIAILPEIPAALAKAKARGVGVIVMKTLRGARLNDLRSYETEEGSFSHAAFRWVLSNPDVDALIVSMKRPEMIDEYLVASGSTQLRASDLALLARYETLNASSQCLYGCTDCADSCPRGVPISDVLRTRMYAKDYQSPELARSEYALLGAGAGACLTCAERSCLGSCPSGLQIGALTEETHRSLGRA